MVSKPTYLPTYVIVVMIVTVVRVVKIVTVVTVVTVVTAMTKKSQRRRKVSQKTFFTRKISKIYIYKKKLKKNRQ